MKTEPYDLKNIGRTIKSKRKSLKMSQGELAQKAGLSQPYLSTIEKCERSPHSKNLKIIAGSLGMSLDILLLLDMAEHYKGVHVNQEKIPGVLKKSLLEFMFHITKLIAIS